MKKFVLMALMLPWATSAQSLDELKVKYPDADLAARELKPGLYDYSILKKGQAIGSIGFGADGPSLQMSCMYCGKKIAFLGEMTAYIGVIGSKDMRSRIVNTAALDYDPDRKDNPLLSTLGVIPLNENGFVISDAAKTGLINWVSRFTFNDEGRSRSIVLSDVTCWFNRGGENWLAFKVGRAREIAADGKPGADVPLNVKIDRDGPNGVITVLVAERFTFTPSMKDDSTLIMLPKK